MASSMINNVLILVKEIYIFLLLFTIITETTKFMLSKYTNLAQDGNCFFATVAINTIADLDD